MTRLYIWLSQTISRGISSFKYFISDAYDTLNRNRIILFFTLPLVLMFITYALGYVIQFIMVGIMTGLMHMTWNDAANHSYAWIGAFGVPLAAASIAITMMASASRSTIRGNGGFHFLPDDVSNGSMRRKSLGAVRSVLSGAFIGMIMWSLLNILVNALYGMGIDASGSSSTTKSVTQSFTGTIGVSHQFTVVSGVITVVFSALLSPLLEEMFFRGLLGRSLMASPMLRKPDGRRGIVSTIMICILSGLWFGIAHINGSDTSTKMIFTVSWMVFMGALFTWLATMRQGGLLLTVSAHVVYNVITLLSVAMFPSQLATIMFHAVPGLLL